MSTAPQMPIENHVAIELMRLHQENERLRAVMAWTGQVTPGKNLESGGAIVHMTWEEFNAMREAIGLPRVQSHTPRRTRHSRQDQPRNLIK
jgi:hypothetical protein